MKDLFLAPLVVSQRLPLLWLESIGLAPGGRKESERMVTEKVEAISQGVLDAQRELLAASFAMSTAMMFGKSPAAAAIRGTKRVARAAMRPSSTSVRNNLRRLSGNA